MKMKKIFWFFAVPAALAVVSPAFGQGIYLVPTPTNVMEPARLYVDISSADCACPELQDADPQSNPLYIWTWVPVEARPNITVDGESLDITNGEWGSSNENMRMKQDPSNPNLWYYDFFEVPLTTFYNSPATNFYSDGIHFLLKEKNGAPTDLPEQKSPDLMIVPESPGCVEIFCPFPTIWFPSDYMTITYNNNIETIGALQDLDPANAFIYFAYRVDGGPLQYKGNAAGEEILMADQGDGTFTVTMVPDIFFNIPEGSELTVLNAFVSKPPVAAPPFSQVTMAPGCP